MSDNHALSGAYAVDALDDLERARFERHLTDCETCRAEVRGLCDTAALLAETSALTPPAGLRARVLADISAVRPLPPQVGVHARKSPRRLGSLLVAAAAVVAIGVGGVVWQPWDRDDSVVTVADPVQQVLRADDAERYSKAFPDGSKATLVRSSELNRAVLLTDDMEPPPPGKIYQLWLQDEVDGMVPAGLMPAGENQMVLTGDAALAIGAGITIEPEGGSRVPTSEPVALFTFRQT